MEAKKYQRLKAVAALSGKTIRDCVLERVLLPSENTAENEVVKQLEDFLKPRIEAAERGVISAKSVNDVFGEVIKAHNGKRWPAMR